MILLLLFPFHIEKKPYPQKPYFETAFAKSASKKKGVTIFYERGVEMGKSMQYSRAINEFKKVIELDPKHEKALLWLGWLHRKLGREENYDRKSMLEKSIEYYKKAIEADRSTSSLNELSSVYLEMRMYEEAKDAADKAIEMDEENARAWHYRGVANRFLGNLKEAKSDFEKSLELDEDNYIVEKNLSAVNSLIDQ